MRTVRPKRPYDASTKSICGNAVRSTGAGLGATRRAGVERAGAAADATTAFGFATGATARCAGVATAAAGDGGASLGFATACATVSDLCLAGAIATACAAV